MGGEVRWVRNNTVLSAKTTKTQNTTLLGPELTKTFSCKEWLCHLRAQPSRPPNTTDPRPSGTRGTTHAFQTTNSDKSDFLRLLTASATPLVIKLPTSLDSIQIPRRLRHSQSEPGMDLKCQEYCASSNYTSNRRTRGEPRTGGRCARSEFERATQYT